MKKSHIIVLLLIGCLISYIVVSSSSYSTYETFATAHSHNGKDFQVVGHLAKDKEMYYEPEKDPNYFTFFMTDSQGEERKVVYRQPRPTDFERSEQIVLHGHMQGEEFHASKILLKCPSKYKEEIANGQRAEL